MTGKITAIWIKRFKLGPMNRVTHAELIKNQGLKNDANPNGKRQVTIICQENWQRMMAELDTVLDPSVRRANIMVSGIDLKNSRGKQLKIGPSVIKINGETKPCERMDQAFRGLRKVMQPNWNGGVFGEVIQDGIISVDDKVTLE